MVSRRAILVDLDGTLVDTGAANHAAYAHALAEVGIEISRERFDTLAAGRNWRQFLPALLSDTDSAAVADRKGELYPTYFPLIRINEALVRLLRQLRCLGPVALVTTASRRNAHGILKHFDLLSLFDLIVTGDDVDHHKPDPQAYQLAATRLGCAPQDCLVIEDSTIGIEAGQAFGAEVLVVTIL